MTATTAKIWSRVPTAGDVLHVARAMRAMDRAEILGMLEGFDADLFAAVTTTLIPRAPVAIGVGLDGSPFCAAVLLICKAESSPWLGFASLFATDDFPRLAPWLIRRVRRGVIPALLASGMRRVECRALASYTATRRFLKACGAVEEGMHPDVGPSGETYVTCAWRRSDYPDLE